MNSSKISVLIVEDDKFISGAYKTKFESVGFVSKCAFNGEEALAILKKITPDIIILDIVMPIKNGFEVLKFLKKDLRLSKIPVIVASNLGEDQYIVKAKEMGASDYILKSELTLNEIVEKINKFVK